MKLTDESLFPFGKYKGEKMWDVPATYLDWLMSTSWIDKWPDVVGYIGDNRAIIDRELRNSGAID